MGKVFWLAAGFIIGIAFARNQVNMESPERAAVYFMVIVAAALFWWAGFRGKNSAVATAVAIAKANAEVNFNAELEAKAAAIAQNAVNVYFGRDEMHPLSPPNIKSIRDELTYYPAIDNDVHSSIVNAKTKEIDNHVSLDKEMHNG